MTDTDLQHLAKANRFVLARSGEHYLLADRWGDWQAVDGSVLLTSRQVAEVIEADRKMRGKDKVRQGPILKTYKLK